MGGKSRQKQKTRSGAPDDYFAAGPLEFARFGRHVVCHSRAGVADWEEINAKMAARLPTITAEIDDLVAQIAEQVARLHAFNLVSVGPAGR